MARSALGSDTFSKGMRAFQKEDYLVSRKYFEQASLYSNYRRLASYYLLKIDLKEGKYKKVRNTLEANEYVDDLEFISLYGLLESIEANFLASRNYYQQCVFDYRLKSLSLINLARIHIQLCEYEEAKKLLCKIRENDEYYATAVFTSCDLALLEGDCQKGISILSTLDLSRFPFYIKSRYQYAKLLLESSMNKVDEEDKKCCNNVEQYSFYRLFHNDEEALLEHIIRHKSCLENREGGYFFENLDLSALLKEVRSQIPLLNSNYARNADSYRIDVGRPIGYFEEKEVSTVRVISILNRNRILTMYPVALSDKYDQEGFTTDHTIMEKRRQYVKK